MKSKDVTQIKNLIRKIVQEEIAKEKKQIIMEVKSELFDSMFSKSLNENTAMEFDTSKKHVVDSNDGLDKEDIRNLFSKHMPLTSEYKMGSSDSIPSTPSLINNLPKTFESNVTENTIAVAQQIEKTNYRDVMKKMGIIKK